MFNWFKKKDKKEKNSNFSLGGVTQEAILGAYKKNTDYGKDESLILPNTLNLEQKEKIEKGAKDFATRFESVMKELANG